MAFNWQAEFYAYPPVFFNLEFILEKQLLAKLNKSIH